MVNLSTILKQLMHEEGIKTAALARETGILQPVLHKLVAGTTDNPRIKTLLPVAKFFNISLEQLMGESPLPADRQAKNQRLSHMNLVPLIQHWGDINSETHKNAGIDDSSIVCDLPCGENTFALKVQDSTMLPQFSEGSLIIVDPSRDVSNGQLVIIRLPHCPQPIFKKILFDVEDIYLKPLNTDFKTITVPKNEAYEILGVVIEHKTLLAE